MKIFYLGLTILILSSASVALNASGLIKNIEVIDSYLTKSEKTMFAKVQLYEKDLILSDKVIRYKAHSLNNTFDLVLDEFKKDDFYFDEYIYFKVRVKHYESLDTYNIHMSYSSGKAFIVEKDIAVTPILVVITTTSCGTSSCSTDVKVNGVEVSNI